MWVDRYGQVILAEDDLCSMYLEDPGSIIKHCLATTPVNFDPELELTDPPSVEQYVDPAVPIEEFDRINQLRWNMPDEYLKMDIAGWLLDRCTAQEELQRVGAELLLYQERDLFNLLRYLKYLVDTMRKYNIVWGVGRGSSVSSYVLYLLGVHRIDSMYYDLDIREFLR